MAEKTKLVLLDSHAILHRAYHALPDFASAKGEATGALYGLAAMLIKIAQELKPDYIVACRDLHGKTHRHTVYADYKATRAQAEDALIEQLKKAPEVFAAFGIPVFSAAGYEADDCLGTIVHQLKHKKNIEIIIATGDMDTLQLVGDNVKVFTLRKGLNDTIMYDSAGVRERYGFGPEHVTDYKGLRGDPSDNIKGIKGIGEKTATDLIQAFGSIEELYKVLEKSEQKFLDAGVKPRIIELLKAGKSDAEFSKKLATISHDAPISFALPEHVWRMSDYAETIVKMCDELDFKSLKERVKKQIEKHAPTSASLSLFGAEPEPVRQDVDPARLQETSVACWLVRSDVSNPSLEDILRYAKVSDFEQARTIIFRDLKQTGKLQEVFDTIEKPLIPVVNQMNKNGIKIDVPHMKGLVKEYSGELKKISVRIYKHAGHEFNINSTQQLATVLYDELRISLPKQKKTATGARTTREEELQKMADQHPVIADVLAYRELQKLVSTYVEKIPKLVAADGRLYTTFVQAGTTTGRMACEEPNLQNIPIKTEYGRRIREGFVARKGFSLVALDYSQIELRIAAGISGDTHLVDAFKKGEDIHRAVAAQVFNVPAEKVDAEMRRKAKVINFGILYGMGVSALRAALGTETSREEASRFMDEYFAKFRGLASYIEHAKVLAKRRGFTETIFGRRRYLPGLQSPLPNIQAQAERFAINAPIQGAQSDIVKLAMVEADTQIQKHGWQDDAFLVLQIHDELVYEIRTEKAQEIGAVIKKAMEGVAPSDKLSEVPIITEMEVGKNWGEI
ncbi:hypothetical protein EBR66_02025 [bacterium]|nr:hypothetical protein [bacterium]